VFEGGDDDPVHILRPSGSGFAVPKSSRPALAPGRTGWTTWGRSTVLRRCQALGFAVECKVSGGSWVGVDVEGEGEAAAAAVSPFDAARDGSLAVFEGGDDDPVHILRPSGSGYYIPVSSRPVLEPGTTGSTAWVRSSVLRRCQALGFAVECKVSGSWVGVDVEGEAAAAGP
jgi:hypothetical protein